MNIRKIFDVDYKVSTRSILRWFWHASEGIRLRSLINMLMGMTYVAIDFGFIWATKMAIDSATHTSQTPLWLGVSLIVALMLFDLFLSFINRWIGAILGVKCQNLMQLRVFSRLMHSEWTGREKHHSGDTMNRLITDAGTITGIITDTVPGFVCTLFRLVWAFIFLYSMQPMLALLLICITPLFLVISKAYINMMRQLNRDIRDTDSKIQSILQESLQHRMVLKTLEQSTGMVDKLANTQAFLRGQIVHRTKFSSFSSLAINACFTIGYLITFIWGVYNLQAGAITYGMMLAFVQLVGQIQGPIRSLTQVIPTIITAFTSAERIMELEKAPLEDEGDPILFPDGAGVRMTDVSFTYEGGRHKVLDKFSFDFRPGTTTAIVGETGSGKTTLIRLILALLHPSEGRVEFYPSNPLTPSNSSNLKPETVEASPRTRCNLVYVPQGNTLFSGTIRDNLLLGDPNASDEEMRVALRMACAEFVFRKEEGLDFHCGESGEGLSEGQAQRIAIARALLRHGNVLLLDEATSALDSETEQQLVQNISLQARTRNQTIIFITHRLSLLDYCTSTIHLEHIKD